jgi:type I restriction enzyme S subunit
MLDAKRITGEHLLPYLRNIDVQWDRVSVEDLPEMDIASDEYARYTLNEGDLLICEGGEVGRAATWRGELSVCGFQKAIHRVRPRTGRDLPRFLYYVMRAAASSNVFVAYGNPNTIAHLTAEKLRVYRFAFPPLDEQGAIVERLDGEAGRIDTLAAKLRTSIATLREYRTALISAAVTGKIDVGTTASAAKPAARANPYFRRAVLAAEIVYRLHADQKFGRVKLQKILYLCQHHLAMDLSGNFQRDAAGPFDNQMMRSVESQMARSRWYRRVAQGQRSTYVPMAKAGQHRTYFDRYWDQETVDALVELVRPMTTEQVEIVATLFAAWNDLILAGIPFSDDGVIHEVRTNWHESKERFTEDRLRKAMQWMRDKGMVPQGRGRATTLRSAGDGESGEE